MLCRISSLNWVPSVHYTDVLATKLRNPAALQIIISDENHINAKIELNQHYNIRTMKKNKDLLDSQH